jgi:hypothetical protein
MIRIPASSKLIYYGEAICTTPFRRALGSKGMVPHHLCTASIRVLGCETK